MCTFLPFRAEAGRSLTDFLASAITIVWGRRRVARPVAARMGSAARSDGVKDEVLAMAGA